MNFSLSLIDISVTIATILGVGMLIPQAVDMARTRDFGGVSGAWIGGGLAVNGGWLVYAYVADLPGLVPVSLGGFGIYAAMSVMVAQESRGLLLRLVVAAAVVGMAFTVAGLQGGEGALGLAIAFTYAAQFSPAAWGALRADDPSGVSVATWVMAFMEAVIWAIYGQYRADLALTVGGTGAALMSALVLLGLWRAQSRRSTTMAMPWPPPTHIDSTP